MKILVIEDEVKTAKFLKKGLGEAGYVIDVAADGLEGLHLAQEVDFDLIVLDVMGGPCAVARDEQESVGSDAYRARYRA